MPTNPERLALSDHPLWAEAEADLRAVLEHMTVGVLSRRYSLGRQASDVVYPRALLAAVALELVQELVFARPAIGAAERAAVAQACYATADLLASPDCGGSR